MWIKFQPVLFIFSFLSYKLALMNSILLNSAIGIPLRVHLSNYSIICVVLSYISVYQYWFRKIAPKTGIVLLTFLGNQNKLNFGLLLVNCMLEILNSNFLLHNILREKNIKRIFGLVWRRNMDYILKLILYSVKSRKSSY